MSVIAETRPALRPSNSLIEAQSYESISFLPEGFEWDRSKALKIAFIGQGQFGADSLRTLIADGHEVTEVYGLADEKDTLRMAVREEKNKGSNVSYYIAKDQFVKGNSDRIINKMKYDEVDLIVMAFVDDYVSSLILETPGLGAVEYHPSELPEEAGPSSIPYAIVKGKRKTAMSLLRPGKILDGGPILLQVPVRIDTSDTPFSLNEVMAPAGTSLLRDGIRLIAMGKDEWIEQDLSRRTEDKRAAKPNAEIDHSLPAEEVYNKARGLLNVGPYVRFENPAQLNWPGKSYDEDTILNLGGVIFLLNDELPGYEINSIVSITEEGMTVKTEKGAVRYSDVTISRIVRNDRGNITEDRTARGQKVSGLDISREYGLKPGIKFATPSGKAA